MNTQSAETVSKLDNYTKTLELGAVELIVRELGPLRSFYEGLVGLDEISAVAGQVELGAGGQTLIRLIENKQASPPPESEAGLYHTALVFPTRARLAKTVLRIVSNSPGFYQGSADHLATEAFYFSDPEGNGVELYFDRPRSQWHYEANGKPKMGSEYIDERAFVQNNLDAADNQDPIRMGHVHLKIGDIAKAKEFYLKTLGFDEVAYMPTALFVSLDGYHHHIGMNIWHSRGAGLRKPGHSGLQAFEMTYLDKTVFDKVVANLAASGVSIGENARIEAIAGAWPPPLFRPATG